MSAKGKWDRRSWHRKAGRPVSLWLGAIVVAGLVHQLLPNSRWVLIHLFTLGAVTNSIVVWSQHFTEKFLHAPAPDEARPWQLRRIYALNLGIVVTVAGQLTTFWQVTTVGAAIVGLILAWHAIALARQYRQHNEQQRYAPVVLAYVASACCMPFGATAGALLAAGVGTPWYDRLKLAHLAINILGFLGFAAVGSLAILFPTIWRTRAGTDRMGQVLSLTMVGLLTIVIGSLLGLGQIAGAGLLIYCGGWIIAAFPWANNVRTVLQEPRDRVTFASVSVAAAPLWLIGSLLYLAVQAIEADTHVAHVNLPTLSLLVGFAAQLLIGVMSFLLPSTIGGGPRGEPSWPANPRPRWTLPLHTAERGASAVASLPLRASHERRIRAGPGKFGRVYPPGSYVRPRSARRTDEACRRPESPLRSSLQPGHRRTSCAGAGGWHARWRFRFWRWRKFWWVFEHRCRDR